MLTEKYVDLRASLRILSVISVHIWQNLMTLEPPNSLKFHIGRDACMHFSFRDNTFVPDTDSKWESQEWEKNKTETNKSPPKSQTNNKQLPQNLISK